MRQTCVGIVKQLAAALKIHHFINPLADNGLAAAFISSYPPEIMNLSDRILVCRQGRVVEEISLVEAGHDDVMFAAVH